MIGIRTRRLPFVLSLDLPWHMGATNPPTYVQKPCTAPSSILLVLSHWWRDRCCFKCYRNERGECCIVLHVCFGSLSSLIDFTATLIYIFWGIQPPLLSHPSSCGMCKNVKNCVLPGSPFSHCSFAPWILSLLLVPVIWRRYHYIPFQSVPISLLSYVYYVYC